MKEWILRNFWMKLGSILAAMVVWFMITGQISTTVSFDGVRPEILLPENMMLVEDRSESVSVTLVGPRELLAEKDKKDIRITVDLRSQKQPGRLVFTLTSREIRAPRRTKVVEIRPSRLTVEIDRIEKKNLPVEVVFEEKPAPGWMVTGFSLDRSIIPVTGPKSLLDERKSVETAPVDLTGHRRTFLQRVPLRIPGSSAESPSSVEVLVKIERALKQREIRDVPVQVMRGPSESERVRIHPDKVNLLLSGPEEILEGLQPTGIRAYVETLGLVNGRYELPVKVDPSKNLKVGKKEPEVLEVVIGDELEPVLETSDLVPLQQDGNK